MPTQVDRAPSSDPLHSPRVGVDKYPSPSQHDPMHPSCDPRTKFNLQHREALRTALGSILAPKRPSMSGSRSSSGTASPAQSFSGSSGTYTPATPPGMPYTPSLDASNSQEHPFQRFHLPPPHYHPTHLPSKLGRVESHTSPSESDVPSSVSTPHTPPQHSPVAPPHPLFRSRSHNPSNPPSSRTGPRTHPLTPPLLPTVPATIMTDTTDLGPPLSPPPPVATSRSDGGEINTAGHQMPPPSILSRGDVPTVATLTPATVTNGTGSPSLTPSQQHPDVSASGYSGAGKPRAKFLQTLQGNSAWDALIHGSFS